MISKSLTLVGSGYSDWRSSESALYALMCLSVCFRLAFMKRYANIYKLVTVVRSLWATLQYIECVSEWPASFSSSSCSQSKLTVARAAVRTSTMGELDWVSLKNCLQKIKNKHKVKAGCFFSVLIFVSHASFTSCALFPCGLVCKRMVCPCLFRRLLIHP